MHSSAQPGRAAVRRPFVARVLRWVAAAAQILRAALALTAAHRHEPKQFRIVRSIFGNVIAGPTVPLVATRVTVCVDDSTIQVLLVEDDDRLAGLTGATSRAPASR